MTKPTIYLDHAATTPLRPEAQAAMLEGFAMWANPSSPHRAGRAARAALENARECIKSALQWDGELIFTSGASEALAIGLGRANAERQLVTAVEHDAVFRSAPDAEVVSISDGAPDRASLASLLAKGGRAVVAIQSVNSETGTCLLPMANNPAVAMVRASGGIVIADCSQSAVEGKLPDVDMAVVSAHKLGGPIGIGALLVRNLGLLKPSGGQEQGYRHGTENLPLALGFAAAADQLQPERWGTTPEQRFDFKNALQRNGQILQPGFQCSHILAVASPAFSANALLIRLDSMGFAISAGSACSSGSLKPSRVLAGFGIDPEVARRTIRVSLGWSTTPAELDAFADAWERLHA